MVITYSENAFENLYHDDFSDSAGFQRILFNPRKSLQARELTQLQTILQNQITKFGQNIFKEGAAVNPGGLFINDKSEFIKLQEDTIPDAVVLNEKFLGQTSNIEFQLISAEAAAGADPATIYVRYTNSLSGTSGASPITVLAGETLVGQTSGTILTVQATNTIANPAVGLGVKVSSNAGSFFTQGFFVYAPAQTLIVSKYNRNATLEIGYKVIEDIVTADDDSSLFDNTGAVPNLTAPGADRFRIRLILIDKANIVNGETFVSLGKIVNSNLVNLNTGSNQYNKINDLLATRTNEESGDYLVTPFNLAYDSATSSTLKLTVSNGTAYVNGYRAENPTPSFITVNRAQTAETLNNSSIGVEYGDFVIISQLTGVPDIEFYSEINLVSSVDGLASNAIGTARVRSIDKVGDGTYRCYIFDLKMNTNQSFRNVRSIASADASFLGVIQLSEGIAKRNNTNLANLLFPLPRTRPQELSDISMQVQRKFTGTTDATGQAIISLSDVNESFTNANDWIISVNGVIDTSVVISGGNTSQAIISGLAATQTFNILAYVAKSSATAKTKSLTNLTQAITLNAADSAGIVYGSVGVADVFEFTSITQDSADGPDISSSFITDNGQRDTHYGTSRIRLKTGKTNPITVYVKVKYFQHSTNGDFYSINSYSGIDYADIPSHVTADGTIVQLRNVLDFRPVADINGNYNTNTSRINELPQNTDNILADINYYQSRWDKIVINENGQITNLSGEPSLTPNFPVTPENCLELYRVKLNPYTLDNTDISVTKIDTKGYTMSEIAGIEKRIERLEETTALSLLELDTNNLAVYDSAGNDRTKSGYMVDNFADFYHTDDKYSEFKASIDPQNYKLRPAYYSDNIGLQYDSDNSTNTILKGDNIYIKYAHTPFLSQLQASRTENVNPFAAYQFNGNLKLSPASDEWKDVRRLADKVISGGTLLNGRQLDQWNEWQWAWGGSQISGLQRGDTVETSPRTTSSSTSTQRSGNELLTIRTTSATAIVQRVVSSETIREVVADRVVDVALLPYIRSRKVFFKGEGLRPNVKIIPYFDGIDVSAWCKEETFKNFSTNKTEYGNTQNSLTGHPETASNLFSDAEGRCQGSFFIPNTSTISFRSGTREFTLLDITSYDPQNSSTVAVANYDAKGLLETKQRTVKSTRSIQIITQRENVETNRTITGRQTVRQRDPIAQSFFIENAEGLFISKVRLFFESKDETLPVQIQVRPMVNGSPSSDVIIPGSIVSKNSTEVNISANATAATDFEFDEPLYLDSYSEYCIVVICDTTKYNVWTSYMGDFELGSTARRIVTQPTLGSFFKSQNSSTWEPAQLQDLKMELFRCAFSGTTGTAQLYNSNLPNELLEKDPFEMTAASNYILVHHKNHGFTIGDKVTISGVTGTINGIPASELNTTHTISNFNDQEAIDSYYIQVTTASISTKSAGGTTVQATKNMIINVINPSIEVLLPQYTNITLKGKFLSGKSIAGSEVPYQQDTTFEQLQFKENTYFNVPKVVANTAKETTLGTSSIILQSTMTTDNNFVAPVIDLQRASIIGISNRIENQSNAISAGFNIPHQYINETDPNEGSSPTKHVTKPVTLINDAVGLKILLGANKPRGADFKVYWRTCEVSENIYDFAWTLVTPEGPQASDENPEVFRDYRYLVGGDGGTMDAFTKFQVKIVFTSNNSSKVPTIKDLRLIALGI